MFSFKEEPDNIGIEEIDDNLDNINECLMQFNELNANYYNYLAEQTIAFNEYETKSFIQEDYGMLSEAISDFKDKIVNGIKTLIGKVKEYIPKICDWIKRQLENIGKYIKPRIQAFTLWLKGNKVKVSDSGVVEVIEEPNDNDDDSGEVIDTQFKEDATPSTNTKGASLMGNLRDIANRFLAGIGLLEKISTAPSMINAYNGIQDELEELSNRKEQKGNAKQAILDVIKAPWNFAKMFDRFKAELTNVIKQYERKAVAPEPKTEDQDGATTAQKKATIFGKISGFIKLMFGKITKILSTVMKAIKSFAKSVRKKKPAPTEAPQA